VRLTRVYRGAMSQESCDEIAADERRRMEKS
jgi:hypothetical protein